MADVERIIEGGEPIVFKDKFKNWGSGIPISMGSVVSGINTSKVQLTGNYDVSAMHKRAIPPPQIEIDNASGSIKVLFLSFFHSVCL